MSFARRLCSLLGFSLAAVSGIAGEFWLRPDRFGATPGATVGAAIEFVSDPAPTSAPKIGQILIRLAGSPISAALAEASEVKEKQRVVATFERPGWAVWLVEATPATEVLSASDLESRLQLLQAPLVLRQQVARSGQANRWRLASQSYAKCITAIGEPEVSDQSWAASTGDMWDLIPQTAPSSFRLGLPTAFSIVAGGRPVPGGVVTIRSLDFDRELVGQTGHDGVATFEFTARGLWVASASHVQISSAAESLLEVRSVSLVFEVK